MLITFEGIEGSGKSTQCGLLKTWLKEQGWRVDCSKEPGGTRMGAEIRSMLLNPASRDLREQAELFLYLADRAQHVAERIRPALEEGRIVLVDRFADSTLAYQGFGRGLDLAVLRDLNAVATQGLSPDLTILIDLPAEEGLLRARRRNHDQALTEAEGRFEEEDLQFHRRVRQGFQRLARGEPERIKLLSGSRPAEEIGREIRYLVGTLLAGRRSQEA